MQGLRLSRHDECDSRVDILFMQYATKSSARANNRGFIFQADMTGSTAHVLTCKVEIRRLRDCL